MSKLYTEEQVNQVRINGFWNSQDFTPIELPTDEEIEDVAYESFITDSAKMGFAKGAQWMKDKIKGGQE